MQTQVARLYEHSRQAFEELGDRSSLASSLDHLGQVAQSQGDLRQAMDYYLGALALFQVPDSLRAPVVALWLNEIRVEVGDGQYDAWFEELSGGAGEGDPPALEEVVAGADAEEGEP